MHERARAAPLRSAAYRIALIYSGAFVLATLLLGLMVYLAAHAALVRQLDAQIESTALDLKARYADEGRQDLIESIRARERLRSPGELGFALFAADGRRIAGDMDTGRPRLGWSNIIFIDPEEGADPGRALAIGLPDGTRLAVAADREPLEAIDRRILVIFAVASLAILLLGIVGGLILGAYLRGRIGRIGRTAEAIVSGDLARRMPIGPRGDEFDDLARTLNRMLDRIERLMNNLRQISSDIAHDLRTPLSRLRNHLEEMRSGDGVREEDVQSAVARTDDILKLFAAILRISELERGAASRYFVPLRLDEIARDICESYAPAIEDSGRSLACAIDGSVTATGDRELISQIIANLLDNAMVHTPIGTHITLTLNALALVIADNGHGIASEDRTRVLQRFVRLDQSRTRPGHGLGLNLAAAIVEAHGWTIAVESNNPGTKVRIGLIGS